MERDNGHRLPPRWLGRGQGLRPVEVGLRRKAGGDGDAWNRMEQKEIAYHRRVRAGYLDMAAGEPERWVVVDASLSIEAVRSAIRKRIERESGRIGPRMKGEDGGEV